MARGDSRLGTWQVLLTISMVITPLSAHGESVFTPAALPRVCGLVRVCLRVRAGLHFFSPPHPCENITTPAWKCKTVASSAAAVVFSGSRGRRLSCVIWSVMFFCFFITDELVDSNLLYTDWLRVIFIYLFYILLHGLVSNCMSAHERVAAFFL